MTLDEKIARLKELLPKIPMVLDGSRHCTCSNCQINIEFNNLARNTIADLIAEVERLRELEKQLENGECTYWQYQGCGHGYNFQQSYHHLPSSVFLNTIVVYGVSLSGLATIERYGLIMGIVLTIYVDKELDIGLQYRSGHIGYGFLIVRRLGVLVCFAEVQAWEHYDLVLSRYNDWYVQNFEDAVERGEVPFANQEKEGM